MNGASCYRAGAGIRIRVPETIRDVSKDDVPRHVAYFGGHAVVKVPYSNAGQGVYTILCPAELEAFMAEDHHYDKFIVQSLVGNSSWGSVTAGYVCMCGTLRGFARLARTHVTVEWDVRGWLAGW